MVINSNRNNEFKSEELNCVFDQIGLYIGVNTHENIVQQQAKHREIIKKKYMKKKKYLMENNRINTFYNIEQQLLSI